ncbi:hypothetical protein BD414DRAFT_418575 [Trametes punicea]|nr:hypothetical protein BD414DRAFT_418575 [Trametes punicea]
MAIFSFHKTLLNTIRDSRTGKFSSEGKPCAKDTRSAFAPDRPSPSPFQAGDATRPITSRKYIAGKKPPVRVDLVSCAATSQHCRPFMVKKGTAGVEETSGSDTDPKVVKDRRRRSNRFYFSRRSRYTPRMSFKPGDRVLVKALEGERWNWRHGVVASFQEYPLQPVTMVESRYPVTYEYRGRMKTNYFYPRHCEILFDRVLSKPMALQTLLR